jgi:hypothetical protein
VGRFALPFERLMHSLTFWNGLKDDMRACPDLLDKLGIPSAESLRMYKLFPQLSLSPSLFSIHTNFLEPKASSGLFMFSASATFKQSTSFSRHELCPNDRKRNKSIRCVKLLLGQNGQMGNVTSLPRNQFQNPFADAIGQRCAKTRRYGRNQRVLLPISKNEYFDIKSRNLPEQNKYS